MALNKRTIILLVLAVVIWGIAIVVLYINYGPKKSSPQPSSGSLNQATQQAISQTNLSNSTSNNAASSQNSGDISSARETTSATMSFPSQTNLSITELASLVEYKVNVPNVFEPYFVDLVSLLSGVAGDLESKSSSVFIEDITSDNIQYHGYLEIRDGKSKITKLYLTLNGETRSWLSDELIDAKYKVIYIGSKHLVVLDTTDGKIKKIGVSKE